MDTKDSSAKSSSADADFLVNKRGQVRPRKYNSKLKTVKRSRSTIEHDEHDEEPNFNENSDDSDLQTFPQNQIEPLCTNDEDNIAVDVITYDTNPLPTQGVQDIEVEQDYESNNGSDVDQEQIQENLVDFLRQKESATIEDLLLKLEAENKWVKDEEENEINDPFDDDEDDIQEDTSVNEDDPIQPGHFLSVKTSVLLIWMYIINHSLTSTQISDLLTLLSLHMMNGYPALKSLYRFKRFFLNLKSSFIKHFYCSFCYSSVTEKQKVCENNLCSQNLKESKDYFIELSIKSQLSALFSRKDFRDGLKHRNERIKRKDKNIEDVYDSENYLHMSRDEGPLNAKNENNISFTFNTDGIPIFKSSKMSLWPIFLMVNELPYRMRKRRDNMIMCGLWFGQNKPVMNLFCRPLHDSLMELEKGINIRLDGKDEILNIHGYLFCVSCDTPARSAVMNMNQHNGESCCPKCTQTGSNHRTVTGGNIRVFPYQKENPVGPIRKADDLIRDANEVMLHGKAHLNGVKGPSFLMFCPAFDPVKNIAIDSMHLLYLGIVRLLMNLWFGVSNSLQNCSIYRLVDVVDSRINDIKPPHFITRTPRSISEHLKFWKAAELRSWFFFYSVPCIHDLLSPKFLYHYCALLEGIYLLNQASISDQDILKSERLLNYFVFMFPCLYGERYMTINMHSLLHLPQLTRQLGPLWSTSCFAFESANGEVLKMFHGTQYIDVQIVNAIHVFQMLPSLTESVSRNSNIYPLMSSLMKNSTKKEFSGFKVYGKCYEKVLDKTIRTHVCALLNKPIRKLVFYKRAVIRGIMYHSLDYTRTVKRNSYTVKFVDKNRLVKFGLICWFAEEVDDIDTCNSDTGETTLIACISVLKAKQINLFEMHHENLQADCHIKSNFLGLDVPHIHYFEETNDKCIVSIADILELCVCIQCRDLNFLVVCEEPNHQEVNL